MSKLLILFSLASLLIITHASEFPSEFDLTELNFIKNPYIDLLSNKTEIKNVFYQKFENSNEGKLIFGEYPQIKTKAYSKRCEIADSKEWSCLLTKLSVSDENSIEINSISYFEIGNDSIVFPESTFNFFESNYFRKSIISNECKIFENKFICNSIKNLQKINFHFDNFSVEINPENLFVDKNNKLEFVVKFSKDSNRISLGQNFLRNFITLFDSNYQKIGLFYPQDEVEEVIENTVRAISDEGEEEEEKDLSIVTMIMVIPIVFLILLIIFLFYFVSNETETEKKIISKPNEIEKALNFNQFNQDFVETAFYF